MKLIDILVRELPKHGGWPEGTAFIGQDYDRELMFYERGDVRSNIYPENLAEDHRRIHDDNGVKITREQYEAALAQSAWDGEGLPPVGIVCEYNSFVGGWVKIRVHAFAEGTMFFSWLEGSFTGTDVFRGPAPEKFRPILNKEQVNYNQTCRAISTILDEDRNFGPNARKIYAAIIAGEIPHVKLEE